MDYTFYRENTPDTVLVGQDPPAEAVAGAIKASQDYSSGLMLAVYESGAGRAKSSAPIRGRATAAQRVELRGEPIHVHIIGLRRSHHTKVAGTLRVP